MDLSLLTVNTAIAFLLVLVRISGMIMLSPLLSLRNIPIQAKIGFCVTIAIVLFPLHVANLVVPHDLIAFTLIVIQEWIIGCLIGFAASLAFLAIQMAGEHISMQMGLSVANVLDPISQIQTPVVGQFFYYCGILVFLSLNIHHGLILSIDRSFTLLPLGHFIGEGRLTVGLMVERMIQLTGDLWSMALIVGAPVMGILLATEIALSFVAKVMPQMNIFMVGLPLKVGLGLLLILMNLPYLADILGTQYTHWIHLLMGLYKTPHVF